MTIYHTLCGFILQLISFRQKRIPWPKQKHPYLSNSHYLIVTNSSEAVGWIATVASKSAFVAPILSATANP